ncbi:MAG: TolC family protein [Muribaculaceae bacterium]|nr:TolC family protein [Muribaculaceae bacterium]
MTNKMKYIATMTLSIAMLSSCGIYKKYETPQDGSALVAEYAKVKEEAVDTNAFGNLRWEEVFTDPVLVDLINKALENNVNLQNAKLNVDIAQAQLKGAKLSYLPSVALAPSGSYSSFAGSDFIGTYQIPLAVSWEIDIFGKLLNNKRSAEVTVEQTKAYNQAVRSQIIGGVANCYYAIATIQRQIELYNETARLWAESIEVMKNLKLDGRLNEAAIVQSTASYYNLLATITDLEVSLNDTNNTMSLLLNVLPQKWSISSQAVMTMPNIVRAGVPMAELAARPDVYASEMELAKAFYATNLARAAFYPNLTISANGGFTNSAGSVIVNPGDWFIQLAGQLTAPLFSRGKNIATLEASKAAQKQAMNNFEYSLLNASAEVSDAMMVCQKSDEKVNLLNKQIENLEKSVEYTQELLTLGTSTYLEVLTAQQNLLAAQMSQLACEHTKTQAIINLYQSLGGGR